jgi:hypothetical protein
MSGNYLLFFPYTQDHYPYTAQGPKASLCMPEQAARNCTQTLKKDHTILRSITGNRSPIVFDTNHQNPDLPEQNETYPPCTRYVSTIEGKDSYPPAFECLKPGTLWYVQCLIRFTFSCDQAFMHTHKAPKKDTYILPYACDPQSLFLLHPKGKDTLIPSQCYVGATKSLYLDGKFETKHAYISYSPIIPMVIKGHSVRAEEWNTSVSWSLTLEEI